MESWGYLQGALPHEESKSRLFDSVGTPIAQLQQSLKPPGKAYPSLPWFCLLAVTVPLLVLEQAIPAMAALTRGSRGPQVATLQTKLRQAGFFKGPVTGFYGPKTEQAVRQFQSSQGLLSDGVAGQKTWAALDNPSIARGQQGYSTNTLELQRLLKQRGFYSGPIDGINGPQTQSAVKVAQQSLGLATDGIAGPMTLRALRGQSWQRSPNRERVAPQDITTLQRLLTERGFYSGPITGIYGPRTRAAVKKAQQHFGLSPDGIAGPKTIAALQQSGSGLTRQNSRLGQATVPVDELQKLLTSRGFYSGPIDGIYGATTQAAVRDVQRAYGLKVDGIAGPSTVAMLRGRRVTAPKNPTTVPASSSSPGRLPVPVRPPQRRAARPKVEERRLAANSMDLQRLLAQAGHYRGELNGVYDARTKTALKAFQKQQGLVEDGIVGALTQAALEKTVSPV